MNVDQQATACGHARGDDETWQSGTYEALRALLGPAKLDDISARFIADLHRRFTSSDDHETARRDAHATTSTAGMLGFIGLSNAAALLEHACNVRHDVEASFKTLLRERDAAVAILTDYRKKPSA